MKIKIGLGYDLHRLEKNRGLFLGGIEIPFRKGLVGHSDGDVLLHAIIDALLGAIGERDIGQLFPDTDPQYKNIRSTEFLKQVMKIVRKKRMKIQNIDSVVIAQEPKIAPHIPRMKEILCPILEIKPDFLGIKAKTNEGVGEIGQGKAISSYAVVLLTSEGEE
ncbi:MAG: 2-C-methyl-D-erythritol 2,4-cyclodiphosphate synthase [Candidatus Aminicenantia bacterium]